MSKFAFGLLNELESGDLRAKGDAEGNAIENPFEQAILSYAVQVYNDSKSQCQQEHSRWSTYWKQYNGEFIAEGNDSNFRELYDPKLARSAMLFAYLLLGLTVPDMSRLDFFQLIPKPKSLDDTGDPRHWDMANMATAGIRNDLIESQWIVDYILCLLDLVVTGNCVMLASWDLTTTWRKNRMPNPDYDPNLPAEQNVRIGHDGLLHPIPRTISKRVGFRERDVPTLRRVNPFNVYPSELDKDSLAECEWVSIYDNVTWDELLPDGIENGGELYANLDKLDPSSEENNQEAPTRTTTDNVDSWTTASESLPRVTQICTLRLLKILKQAGVDGTKAQWESFCTKYNIDRTLAEESAVWVLEFIDEQTLIRCQPLSNDKKPVAHGRLFPQPNKTLAKGMYSRDSVAERLFNYLQQINAELISRIARPMWGIVETLFDPEWLLKQGGTLRFENDKIVKLKPGANIQQAIQEFRFNPQAIAEISNVAQGLDNAMQLRALPQIKGGVASGASATESAILNTSADTILQVTAQVLENTFLLPGICMLLELHNQYDVEPHVITLPNTSGQYDSFVVPPEVWWQLEYSVQIVGFRTVGNLASQQIAFERFAAQCEKWGTLNRQKAQERWARLLQIQNPNEMYTEPPPPQGPEPKVSIGFTGKLEDMAPSVQAKVLQDAGVPLTPEDIAAIAQQEVVKAGMSAEVHQGSIPGMLQQQSGDSGQLPDSSVEQREAERSHHAENEVRTPEGMPDETGAIKSMAQAGRNPMSGRRVTGA